MEPDMSANIWTPVTHSDPKPSNDPRDKPIDFILTPADKDLAIIGKFQAEINRRRQNDKDLGREAARELDSFEFVRS